MSPPIFRIAEDLPSVVPIFPLESAIVFPRGNLPLNIFEPRYLNMVDDAMYSDRVIGMIQPYMPKSDQDQKIIENPPIMKVGCIGRINSYSETDDGRYMINLRGMCRFHIVEEQEMSKPYRTANVLYDNYAADMKPNSPADPDISRDGLIDALKTYLANNAIKTDWDAVKDAPMETLINALASGCPFSTMEKQMLLEMHSLQERGEALVSLLLMDASGNSGLLQ
ncbi:LON peptidase substrate-binding domain-containing protein [Hirschia maritima]|uniref:LON peptidase substrate-binding domain-containing protein n=1 Tax=Hirschia maritima TaxID=1121961 RepID=UPI00039B7C23|nr:LON peptidase substrate-binding domain-containing protein [Hirschia maritima]